MATFTGTLNQNEIFSALYNMIISQEVFGDNIKGDDLVSKARVDGSLFGDQKLYYATDVLSSSAWGNDAEASNLLNTDRPAAPSCQAIVLDVFRQIRLTVDNYMSKRAFSDENSFAQFNSVMLGWLSDTKKVYDGTTYNAYVGTAVGNATRSQETITLTGVTRPRGLVIAEGIANLITDMSDYTTDFNDYGYLRRYSAEEIKIVWNSKYVNEVRNIDASLVFHNDELKKTFAGEVLNKRYFGAVNSAATTGDGSTVRSLVEQVIGTNHYFAGDLIKTTDTAPAGTSYTEDDKIICKVLVKYPPYMSAFEVGTSFFNPRALLENHYLTFGHNTIEYLEAYPMIEVKEV